MQRLNTYNKCLATFGNAIKCGSLTVPGPDPYTTNEHASHHHPTQPNTPPSHRMAQLCGSHTLRRGPKSLKHARSPVLRKTALKHTTDSLEPHTRIQNATNHQLR